MKTVYAISRWSNARRGAARHIDNGEGKPLCGGAGRKAFSWESEEGEPTCKRCIRLSDTLARRAEMGNNYVRELSHFDENGKPVFKWGNWGGA